MKTFEKINPFLIKKVVDFECNGGVEVCHKTTSGTLLVKTKNCLQAQKLIKMKLFHNFLVRAEEYKSLITCKKVIYSNDLRYLDENLI